MSGHEQLWTFGELRAFFHADEEPTRQRFRELFDAMMLAHEHNAGEVEEEWLPYALEMIEKWPTGTRLWDGYVWWNEDEDRDSFDQRSHPLHQLGRFLRVENTTSEEFVQLCHAPDIKLLRSLDVWAEEEMTPEVFERALEGLANANLEHLGLAFFKLDDACAKILAEATHLDGLVSLDIAGNNISWYALRDMVKAPQFKGLRHLHFGDVPDFSHPKANKQLELMALLPKLVTTIEPHSAIPWYEMKSSWEEVETSRTTRSVKARVESVLGMYSDDDDMYPFLGEHFCSYGGFVELEQEEFEREELTLQQVYPRYDEIASMGNLGITSIHVVAVEEGALERSFDEDGNLITPLVIRTFGHHWLGSPRGRDDATYGGACFLQSSFASMGLYVEEGEDGLLRLEPERYEHRSALVRFWEACDLSKRWAGGEMYDYVCTPWYEPLGGHDANVTVRATPVWEEREHVFDRLGEMQEPQAMMVVGDCVPLVRILLGMGFEVREGRWDISLRFAPAGMIGEDD